MMLRCYGKIEYISECLIIILRLRFTITDIEERVRLETFLFFILIFKLRSAYGFAMVNDHN